MSALYYISTLCLCAGVLGVWAGDGGRESRVVNTAQGPVRGYKDPETGLLAFQSIPYATAPTGPNRFKAPLAPPVWMKPLEAVDRGIICPQPPFPAVPASKLMQEDCLIANVYVPDTEETNLPVYVYVHGGGFQIGFSDFIKPARLLIEHNIIAVTFNYRLGAHGFLCLGTEDAPGNAGMKDQVALLRWVKKNIANFGGNPDDVTIGGCSAGGASVDLLVLSKSAEGLFNKAIPESGSNVAVFSVQMDPLENAKMFAKSLNFTDVDNIFALEEFYKTASFETLGFGSFLDTPDSTLVFVSCVERPTGEEMFFDDHPVNIIKKGKYKKVPLLYGFSQKEGLVKVDLFNAWRDKMNENFEEFLPADLTFNSESEKTEVAEAVKQFYFGDNPINENSILGFVDLIGDVMFAYPHLRSVQLQLESGHDQIYLYEYSFVDENDPVIPYTTVRGANHCLQAVAVCDGKSPMGIENVQHTEAYLQMSSIMRQLWANFIKSGTPVVNGSPLPSWPAVRRRTAPHMSLGVEVRLEEKPLAENRTLFWDKIYDKHYREPVPPPSPPERSTTHSEL